MTDYYLFLDGTRKYSYHWQDAQGNCIIRWDNAPHHQAISSFPFHKHLGEQETITESPPMKLHTVRHAQLFQAICLNADV